MVGRITEVGNKRWKVDVNSRQEAVLLLGSINLPGGAQRRRTLEDRLQMRQLFAENDVISCEVAAFYKDGGMSVQTRSLRYGKLENGQLLVVPPFLVKRAKHHFITLNCGVDVVLGHNGYIWLTAAHASTMDNQEWQDDDSDNGDMNISQAEISREVDEMESRRDRQAKKVVSPEERLEVARVANSIQILANHNSLITRKTIEKLYNSSLKMASRPCEMLIPEIAKKITDDALNHE